MTCTSLKQSRQQAGPHWHLAVALLLTHLCVGSAIDTLPFPRPVSALVCPTFARYTRMHRAALNQQLPTSSLARRFDSARLQHLRQRMHGHNSLGAIGTSTSSAIESQAASNSDPPVDTRNDTNATSTTSSTHAQSRNLLNTAGLRRRHPQNRTRWLVTADPDGLADRLVNAVSSFYFALLTDRVLCITPADDSQPGLQEAFSTPNIDWTCGAGANASTTFPPLSGPDVAFWNPTEDDAWLEPAFPVYTTFVRSHLGTVGPHGAGTIVLRMHRGISVALFNNPHHRHQMEAMGLRPDTAFGCAVHYLFGVAAATRQLAAADPGLHAAMMDDNVIKIGIQIRLGDDNILAQIERGGETALSPDSQQVVAGFLGCAEQLAASVGLLSGPQHPEEEGQQQGQQGGEKAPPPPPPAGPPLRPLFFLMTDTLAVRQLAQKRFGSQLLSLAAPTVQFYRNVTPAGLRATALEHWYLSRCHHHVITAHSGMGRTAAFAGLRPGPSLFSVEVADGSRVGGRGCELWAADRPMDVYNTWSGV